MNMVDWYFTILFIIILIVWALWIIGLTFEFKSRFKRLFKRLFKRKPKYRVGQKVRVRSDLINGELYGNKEDRRRFYSSMVKHIGSVVTIEYIDEDIPTHFRIEEDDEDWWHSEMFESFIITKEHAFEALLHGHISDEEYSEIMNVGGVVKWHSRLVKRLK